MARNITLTLGSNAGADLGPFNMTVSSGTITPTIATRSELLAGKVFSISSDEAVTVTTTSTGACTNSTTTSIAAAPVGVVIEWTHQPEFSYIDAVAAQPYSVLDITYTPVGSSNQITFTDVTGVGNNAIRSGTITAQEGTTVSAMVQAFGELVQYIILEITPNNSVQVTNNINTIFDSATVTSGIGQSITTLVKIDQQGPGIT
jgi:surface antigen